MIKTIRHQTYYKVVKHTFREQFASGAGRGKKNAVCLMLSKIRPKGKRNKDTGSNFKNEN